MVLNNQGRQAPMVAKASPVKWYCKVKQRHSFGDIDCLSFVSILVIWDTTKNKRSSNTAGDMLKQ